MALAISDDHEALAAVVGAFSTSHQLRALTRVALEPAPEGLPADPGPVWRQMAELGWLGLHLPEDHGGSGFGMPELAVVVEALGAVPAHGPLLSTVLASAVVAAVGTPAQQAALLPGLADELDAAGVPAGERVLAAIGPRMVALAGERTVGAFPSLVTLEHTASARTALGPGKLLAIDHKVALGSDPARTRPIARRALRPYLDMRLTNYLNNMRRLGFTDDDFTDGGSDRLIDAFVATGDAATVAARVSKHLDAGADQVVISLYTEPGADPILDYGRLADALF